MWDFIMELYEYFFYLKSIYREDTHTSLFFYCRPEDQRNEEILLRKKTMQVVESRIRYFMKIRLKTPL